MMNLLATSEIAEKWDISRMRVTTLCREGRIEGATHRGTTWLIPENAKKRKIQDVSEKQDRMKDLTALWFLEEKDQTSLL